VRGKVAHDKKKKKTNTGCKIICLYTLDSRTNGTNLQQTQAKNRLNLHWFTTVRCVPRM